MNFYSTYTYSNYSKEKKEVTLSDRVSSYTEQIEKLKSELKNIKELGLSDLVTGAAIAEIKIKIKDLKTELVEIIANY